MATQEATVSSGVLCTDELDVTGNVRRFVDPAAKLNDLLEDAEMHGNATRAVMEAIARDVHSGNMGEQDASKAMWGALHLFELTLSSVTLANKLCSTMGKEQ